MSITLHVSLLSGRTVPIEIGLDVDIRVFKRRAERAVSVGKGGLIHSSGSVLDVAKTIGDSELHNGDILSLHVLPVAIQAAGVGATENSAFVVSLGDGSVVTWGDASCGGDSSAVQDQLRNVQQIQASARAFAAILADGSVVTWGDACGGGDSSAVQDRLKKVQQIQSNTLAFAAILADRSVVTWGYADDGGNSSAVQDQLRNVQQIQAIYGAFAAIIADGSVVTWGDASCGGDSSAVQDQLMNVQQIQASACAFAAILADGSVVTWGDAAGVTNIGFPQMWRVECSACRKKRRIASSDKRKWLEVLAAWPKTSHQF